MASTKITCAFNFFLLRSTKHKTSKQLHIEIYRMNADRGRGRVRDSESERQRERGREGGREGGRKVAAGTGSNK